MFFDGFYTDISDNKYLTISNKLGVCTKSGPIIVTCVVQLLSQTFVLAYKYIVTCVVQLLSLPSPDLRTCRA